MKILRLTTALDFGGVEKMYELFASYYQGEHEYVFLALGPDGRTGKKLRNMGFQALSFDFANASVYNPKVTLKLASWLRKNRVDLIHTASAEANFHGTLAGRLAGVPVIVVEEIGIPNHSKMGKVIFRQIYKLATDFVWESRAIKERLVELKEVKPDRGTIIHNPVAVPELSGVPARQDPEEWLIASIGRLAPVKNFEILIRLVANFNQQGRKARLFLIGDGPHKETLESLVNELSAEAWIDMPGFSDIPTNAIAHADLYIQPSFSEGFGISVVEAMMVGLPCIGSHVGGMQDIIEHGKNGWFMDPNDSVDKLAELVVEVMGKTSKEREAIAETGKTSAFERFTPEMYIQGLEGLYERNHASRKKS